MGQAMGAWEIAGIVVAALGALVKGVGELSGGKAEQDVERYNAQVALMAAYDERRRAEGDVTDVRRGYSILTGKQRAAVGASGIAADAGSPAYVLDDTAMLAELDVLRTESNAERAAWGYEVKAVQHLALGSIKRYAAGIRAVSGLLGTAGSLMGSYGGGGD